MEVSGPDKVLLKNGLPFNKYEVVTRERTPKGTTATFYYFDRYADAELYYQYLLQVIGIQNLEKTINNKRTFLWEKKELQEFLDTIDRSILEEAIKDLIFIKETRFFEAIPPKKPTKPERPRHPEDSEEHMRWKAKFFKYEI